VTTKPSIVVIDNDRLALAETIRILRLSDFITKGFPSAEEFLASNRATLTTCLIVDGELIGISGLELYGRLVALGRAIPTILTTGHPDEHGRQRALSAGVACYLTKPFTESDLLNAIRVATKRKVHVRRS
jgi:FixJ family two-component response regulator